MYSIDQTDRDSMVAVGTSAFPEDSYITDGESLFRVERTLLDGPRGELFVELEDCATLELIFCSAQSVAELGLRSVVPELRHAA